MKAIAECPRCGKVITTDCRGCIDNNEHGCSEKNEKMHDCVEPYNVIENIKWKKVPENEKELMEVEEI